MGGGEVYVEDGRQREPQADEKCEPEGELVSLFTEANPHCRVTVREDGVVLAFKNVEDLNQQWIKVDVGKGRGAFVDRTGQPGFVLVHKATGLLLKHGHQVKDEVTIHRCGYKPQCLEGSIMWSLGKKDEGRGYRAMRPVTNVTLNMDVECTGKDRGSATDGCRLMLSRWKADVKPLKWKFEAVKKLEMLPM